jgi:hypothetical protein
MKQPETIIKTPANHSDNRLIIVLIALCLAAYCRTVDVPFIFDDFAYIKDNPFIRDVGNYFDKQKALETFAANPYVMKDTLNSFLTRPLSYLSFSLNYYCHGVTVAGYHIISVSIHTLNVIAVYVLVIVTARLYCENNLNNIEEPPPRYIRKVAFLTASLFAVHPLMTNSVTYIIQRMNSLVALFYLGSILLYAHYCARPDTSNKNVLYCISLVLCSAAMLTKESAFTLPLMLVLYDAVFCRGLPIQRMKRLALYFLTMAIVPFNVIGLRNVEATQAGGVLSNSLNVINFTHVSSWEYLLTQFRAVAFYLKLLLVPLGLSLEHDFRVSHSLADVDVLLSLLLHLALVSYGTFLLWGSRVGNKYSLVDVLAGFGIIWFYLALLVESSIIPLDIMAVEYRTYLPSLGIFLFAVCSLMKIIDKVSVNRNSQRRAYIFWIPVLCMLMYLTVTRNEVWRKPEELWKQTIYLYPKLARPYANLADCYIRKGELAHAIQVYKTSVQEIPYDPVLYYELGNVYMLAKDYESAITELFQAIILKPDMKKAYVSLAKAYVYSGRHAQAIETFNIANQLSHGN